MTDRQTSDTDANDFAAWQPAPATRFPNLIAWVHGWLIPMYRRPVGDGRNRAWCPQWWLHPEALTRLSALWRGYEQHQADPGDAMSAWIRDHLDHHMTILTSPDGPLKGCNTARGHSDTNTLPAWPIADPPPGLEACLAADA